MYLNSACTARYALAARLIHAELHKVAGNIHHAVSFVHDDHSARTHDGSDFGKRFVVDWRIEKDARNGAAGRSARLCRFEHFRLEHRRRYRI